MEKSRNISWGIVLIISLICISLFYGYHKILFYPPQSIHTWRQTDCASLTMNYYQGGMKFFKPEIHNLINDLGTTGYAASSEIPVYYYAIAGLYKIFGPHDFLMRLFNMLIFFAGIIFLYRLFLLLLKDYFWSLVLSLFFFTSPVLVYYANNYLTNISAFSFAIIASYFFIRFYQDKRNKHIYLTALFFLLAGSMKVTGLFSLVVIIMLYLLDLAGTVSQKFRHPGIFNASFRQFIPLLVPIIVIVGWIIYAGLYNRHHHTTYFSTTIFPIWDYNLDGIKAILHQAFTLWIKDYFSPPALLLIAALLMTIIIKSKYADKATLYFAVLLLPVLLIYVLLQFYVFADHDYYTRNM